MSFSVKGIVFLTFKFRDVMGNIFELTDEPCLVSDAIDMNIFGMHTEQRFKSINRDHSKSTMTFTTNGGKEIKLKFFREKKITSSAYVKVSKATLLQPKGGSMIKNKIMNSSKKISGKNQGIGRIDEKDDRDDDIMGRSSGLIGDIVKNQHVKKNYEIDVETDKTTIPDEESNYLKDDAVQDISQLSCYKYLCLQNCIVYSDQKPLTKYLYLRYLDGYRFRWLPFSEENITKVVFANEKENEEIYNDPRDYKFRHCSGRIQDRLLGSHFILLKIQKLVVPNFWGRDGVILLIERINYHSYRINYHSLISIPVRMISDHYYIYLGLYYFI